jgi:hypothetical protein
VSGAFRRPSAQPSNLCHNRTSQLNIADSSARTISQIGGGVGLVRRLHSSPVRRSFPPPSPQQFPRRHQFLNGAGARQSVPLHPARFVRLAVRVRDMVRAQHRQAALTLRQFRAVERAVEFRRIGSPGHNGDRIADSLFLRQYNGGAPYSEFSLLNVFFGWVGYSVPVAWR